MYQNNYSYFPNLPATQPASAQAAAARYQPYLGLKGRPVSSIEEVRATAIDFDGSVFYFPDLANKRIYTKQINLDGTASLSVYELVPNNLQTAQNDYITRSEFNAALEQIRGSILTVPEPSAPQETQAQPAFTF